MPPKRKAIVKKTTTTVSIAARGVSECCVCSNYIVDSIDDALFCDGECNGWMHRYCAGVPLKHFKRLTSTSSPFLCYACTLQTQERETAVLQERETAVLKEMVKSLATELEDCGNVYLTEESLTMIALSQQHRWSQAAPLRTHAFFWR